MCSRTGFVGPEPALGNHPGLVKGVVKREIEQKHQRAWESLDIDIVYIDIHAGENGGMTFQLKISI